MTFSKEQARTLIRAGKAEAIDKTLAGWMIIRMIPKAERKARRASRA